MTVGHGLGMCEGSDDGAFEIEGVCVGIGVGNAVGAVVVGFPVGGIKVVGWEVVGSFVGAGVESMHINPMPVA